MNNNAMYSMKGKTSPLAAACALACGLAALLPSCTGSTAATSDEEAAEEILFADPTIFSEGGKFYLTGTRNTSPLGFVLLESDDLVSWRDAMDSMLITPGERVFGSRGFWAPQIIKKEGGGYTLAYTANEQTVVAHADSLRSPFTQTEVKPVDGSEKNIDPFIFRDDDGKEYIYHVRFDHGNFLWVGEYDKATGEVVKGTLKKCFANTQPWEHTGDYPSDPIMEGPTVIKLDGTYYLFYSANHFMSRDYAVGYAIAKSPTGPWVKNPDNPIIHRSIVGENGAGHGDIFTGKDGELRYVYHVHNSDSVVSPRRTRILTLRLEPEKGNLSAPYKVTADSSTIIKPLYASK